MQSMVAIRTLILSLALIVGAGACATLDNERSPKLQVASEPLAWPLSPAKPRIKFVRSVAKPSDLGIRPSFWKRLGDLFAGERKAWMIRPTDVAVRGDVLYVADPGAQALWIMDAASGRFNKVRGKKPWQLASPVSVAAGSGRSVYVADSYLRKIFVFDAQGDTTGLIENDAMLRPCGLAYDEVADRLYVADSAAHKIWILSGDGLAQGEIGERGEGQGEFNFPTHVSLDKRGHLYVTDSLGFRVQVFGENGEFLSSFGRHGDGSGDFASPKGIGVDGEGHVYVVDALFDAVQIFERSGKFLLGFGQRGINPGEFWLPSGLFVDDYDRIYVADSYNQRIQVFEYVAQESDR